jgi:molybdopterin synthase catalytic subunit
MPLTREDQESMAKVVCELLSTQTEMESEISGAISRAGAILDFRGVVRRLEDGREIRGIEYEAHETMARTQLERLGTDAATQFGLIEVLIRHRVGFVAAGDPSLFIRLQSAHRTEALTAMTWLIEELKKKVPIWKHPEFVATAPPVLAAVTEGI